MDNIVLSICTSGRNDDYGYDFKRRFVQSMNFLAWSAVKAGVIDNIEVVFTDWNSIVPLSKELSLTKHAATMVRFIEVPTETAAPLNHKGTSFHTCKSLNVAFRRAKGKYIAMMPSDILWPQYPLRALLSILNGDWTLPFDPAHAIMHVPRKMLDYDSDDAYFFTSPEEMERLLTISDSYLPASGLTPGINGNSGMFILPREILNTVRGCGENIGGWGYSDDDIALRASNLADVYSLSGYGIMCYDFDPNMKTLKEKEERKDLIRNSIPGYSNNPPDWGLEKHIFNETHAKVTDKFFLEKDTSGIQPDKQCRKKLIERFQKVFYQDCPSFSSLAIAAACTMLRHKPRKACILGLADISCCAAFSITDLYPSLHIVDVSDSNIDRIYKSARCLKKRHYGYPCGRIGHVHYSTFIPHAHDKEEKFDFIICTEKIVSDDMLPSFMDKTGTLIAPYKINGMPQKEYCVNDIYIYTDHPFSAFTAEQDWKPAEGNIFTPILKHLHHPYRFLAMIARLPVKEWKSIWDIYMERTKNDDR